MKKIKYFLHLIFLYILINFPLLSFSQISITSAHGMSVETLLNNLFVGEGIIISNATFNGEATINSNQLGIFNNPSTAYPNMPIANGIVMVTGDYTDASAGNFTIDGWTNAIPESQKEISPNLENTLREYGSIQDLRDVGSIKFDFVTTGDVVSFKYSFASEEYPDYVCWVFNDIFGFFISGPYDENDNLIANDGDSFENRNIALIPGTNSPVSINTVNGGVSGTSNITVPCNLSNAHLFIENTNDNCKFNGYTIELETESVKIIPNKKYKMELAICDVADQVCNSAVYLTANSFSIAPPLISSNSPLCEGETLLLEAQEIENAQYLWTGPGGWSSNLRNPSRDNVTVDMAGDYFCKIIVDGNESARVSTTVEINAPSETVINETICQGEDYNKNGFSLTDLQEDYTGTLNLQTVNGCDSIVTLNLTVNPVYETVIQEEICEGETYKQNGFNLENLTAGTYEETLALKNIYGCDSIVTLNLKVNEIFETVINETICQGEDYNKNGFSLTDLQEDYTGTLNLQTASGCDSIVTLNLKVNEIFETVLNETICQGEDYNKNGFSLTDLQEDYSGTLNLQTASGCDSIVTLNLKVNEIFETIINETICQGEDYNKNGFSLTDLQEDYSGTLNLQTASGCDSIVTLNLKVNEIFETVINETICQGGDYNKNGFSLTDLQEDYTGTLNLQTASGCDSIVTLNLKVNEIFETVINETICQGEDYNKNGFSLTDLQEDYTETLNLQTASGCDSIVTLNLKVNEIFETVLNETICQGEDYNKNGFSLTDLQEDYTGTLNLQTANGCDSIVTLNLKVNEIFETVINETICQGGDYNKNGFSLTDLQEDYTGTLNLQTASGCDSIVTLNLKVNEIFETIINETICQGGDYNKNGFSLTDLQEDYTETLNLQTASGCDSIVTLNLKVNEIFETVLNETICQGEDYNKNGFSLTDLQEDYTGTLNLQTASGCDSIVTLNLKVNEIFETVLNETICQGEDYNKNGFSLTDLQEDYTGSLNLQTASGCDSIVTLNLKVNEIFETVLNETICQGEDYNKNGFSLTDLQEDYSGTLNLQTASGCDSIVTLNLKVNEIFETVLNETICQGEDYNKNGFSLTDLQEDYTRTLNLQTASGCDSIVTLNLKVNEIFETVLNETICQGEDYNKNGFSLTDLQEDYTGTLNLQTVNGCDSIVTLNLTVNPVYETIIQEETCEGGNYNQNGFNLENLTAGTYEETLALKNIYGCDSIVKLYLTVSDVLEVTIQEEICEGSNYTKNGFNLENLTAGTYEETLALKTINGCDSIVTLNLKVNEIFETVLNETICQGEDYNKNGFSLTDLQEDYTGTLNLQTANGCDSIVTLNLKVNEIFETVINETICQGGDYNKNGFSLTDLQEDYTGTLNLQTASGCDSIVTLNLKVNEIFETIINETICQGGDYNKNGFSLTDLQEDYSGTLNLQTANGCDSIVTLNLKVNEIFETVLNETICQGEDYNKNGFSLTDLQEDYSGTLNLQTANGCDSIVTLNLKVNEIFETVLNETICQGEDYNKNGFSLTDLQEDYTGTLNLQTVNGCDSIVTLNLKVNEIFETVLNETICQGGDYNKNGFSLTDLQEDYTGTLNLQTASGCDSIVTLNLKVNEIFETIINETICQGGDYNKNGFSLTDLQEDYTGTLNLQTASGCDSIVTLNLKVNEIFETVLNETICQGEDYNKNGFSLTDLQEDYTGTLNLQTASGCDSIVTLNLKVNEIFETVLNETICQGEDYNKNGFSLTDLQEDYTGTLNLQTASGCDSIVTLNLKVNEIFETVLNETICQGEDYNKNGFSLTDLQEDYTGTLNLQTASGCDSIVTLNLKVNEIFETVLNETICQGGDYNKNGFSLTDLQEDYTGTLNLQTASGCDSIVTLNLKVNEAYSYDVFDTVCEGEEYQLYGLNITAGDAGISEYVSELTTVFGCDSIYNVTLTVIDKYYEEVSIEGIADIVVSTNLATGCYRYTISGADDGIEYTWEIDNEDWKVVADGNGCLVWATTPAKATLTAKAESYCGLSTGSIVLDADFIENKSGSDVVMYPNPTASFINIEQKDISQINIYDTHGQLVAKRKYDFDSRVTLDMSGFEDSLYVIEIITLEQTFIRRISVSK